MTEATALHALRAFHEARKDLFFVGVKNGSTVMSHRGGLKIIDGLAIKPSWVSPVITGYEVKSSRSDYVRDEKWQHYLEEKMCHRLYFATPPGLIKPGELPDGIGLVEITPGGLKWRRKATTKNTEINPRVYQFIVLSRLERSECPFHAREQRAEHYRQWAEANDAGKMLAPMVASRLKEAVARAKRAEDAADRVKHYADQFKAVAKAAGYYNYDWELSENGTSRVTDKIIQALRQGAAVSRERKSLENYVQDAERIASGLRAMLKEKEEEKQ